MKAPNITQGREQKVTANWMHGVNSLRNPWGLPEDQFKWGQNISVRGGIVQTRPGFAMRLSLPAGNFQGGVIFAANKQSKAANVTTSGGITTYTPASIYKPDGTDSTESEIPYVVFAVDGKVYYLPFPIVQPKSWHDYQLQGIALNPNAPTVNFVVATQSAEVNAKGDVSITPSHRLVVIQDKSSQPAYWDGSDQMGAQSATMPVGYWMAYSGNRLWVATGNIIQASDIGNPLSWIERTTGTGRGDFSVPRPVTAMQDYVGQNNDSRLYVFTDRSTYSLASGILDRTQWPTTPNFQSVLFPTLGCLAGKSICFQAGMMWWYAQGGLVSADVAAASYLTSQTLYKDVEMARAKRLMSSDVSGIASVAFENYLLTSIPYAEKANSVTMVMDYAPASEWNQQHSPAWAGVWTGIRPVEWVTGIIAGQPRAFAFSIDYAATNDGSYNHLWEAFTPERYDTYLRISPDGTATPLVNRIYCQMETALLGDAMDMKQLAYGELDCCEIAGTVDVKVSYRGTKGQYKEILSTRVLAATEDYQFNTTSQSGKIGELGALSTQTRRLITESVQRNTDSSCESSYSFDVSKAFSFLIEWCGAFGIEAIRMFQDPWSEKSRGATNTPETLFCAVGEAGQSLEVALPNPAVESIQNGTEAFISTQKKTVTLRCTNGGAAVSATATATVISLVSREDAVAQAAAKAIAEATAEAEQYRQSHPC